MTEQPKPPTLEEMLTNPLFLKLLRQAQETREQIAYEILTGLPPCVCQE